MVDTIGIASGLMVGEVVEDWSADARFFEYSQAADPLASGHIGPVPLRTFPAALHRSERATRVVPLDLSDALGTHRHQSVALDLIIDCPPGCYTLVGDSVDAASGSIVDPTRIDWEPGGAFVTPPGLWHSHHNPTDEVAYLFPIQDAGLHTYLRSLDIRLVR